MDPYRLPPADQRNPAMRWLQAAIAAVAGTALLVLAFFFALFALAAIAILIAVLAGRWWWMTRKARRTARAGDDVVEGEYRVVERQGKGDER
jgi:uncharacterized iron-regulated membrane protein